MKPRISKFFAAVQRLHSYIVDVHWTGEAVSGPDPGIRFNYRLGRFIKSYLSPFPWNDSYYYLQAQGYWILANWRLFTLTGEEPYRETALQCSQYMLSQQRDDGAWDYPNVEWKGRIATAEGCWGALGLLESYRQSADPLFLTGALRWHRFLLGSIGFQEAGNELAINYFAYRSQSRVPNNSAFVLRFLAELATATEERSYLRPCTGLLRFMQRAQKTSGEFPYAVEGVRGGKNRPHFQCYQYNAFQCLDLMAYYQTTGDERALPLISRVLNFLRTGLAEDGYAFYECGNRHRTVTYHTAVLGAAFWEAREAGIDGYAELANRAYGYLLESQRPDGSFPYSQGDYYFLSDQRSYPRYLAMILYHLLLGPATEKDSDEEEACNNVREEKI